MPHRVGGDAFEAGEVPDAAAPVPDVGSDLNGARIAETIGFHELAASHSVLMLYTWI
jgi:hypothetical protein